MINVAFTVLLVAVGYCAGAWFFVRAGGTDDPGWVIAGVLCCIWAEIVGRRGR